MLLVLNTKKILIKTPIRSTPGYGYAQQGFAIWNPNARTFILEIRKFWQLTSEITAGQQQMKATFMLPSGYQIIFNSSWIKWEEKDTKTLPLQGSIKILLCAHKQNYSYHIRAGIKREDEILEGAPSGNEEWPVIQALISSHSPNFSFLPCQDTQRLCLLL